MRAQRGEVVVADLAALCSATLSANASIARLPRRDVGLAVVDGDLVGDSGFFA